MLVDVTPSDNVCDLDWLTVTVRDCVVVCVNDWVDATDGLCERLGLDDDDCVFDVLVVDVIVNEALMVGEYVVDWVDDKTCDDVIVTVVPGVTVWEAVDVELYDSDGDCVIEGVSDVVCVCVGVTLNVDVTDCVTAWLADSDELHVSDWLDVALSVCDALGAHVCFNVRNRMPR